MLPDNVGGGFLRVAASDYRPISKRVGLLPWAAVSREVTQRDGPNTFSSWSAGGRGLSGTTCPWTAPSQRFLCVPVCGTFMAADNCRQSLVFKLLHDRQSVANRSHV